MSLLGKLKFWKKEDEFDFDELASKELEKSAFPAEGAGFDQPPAGFEPKDPFAAEEESPGMPQSTPPGARPQPWREVPQRAAPLPPAHFESKDMELINSKLDTLKAMLTSLEQRLENLERAGGVQKKEQRLW